MDSGIFLRSMTWRMEVLIFSWFKNFFFNDAFEKLFLNFRHEPCLIWFMKSEKKIGRPFVFWYRLQLYLFTDTNDYSFASVWSLMRNRFLVLSQSTLILGRVLNTSTFQSIMELGGYKTKFALLRNGNGVPTGSLGGVLFHSALDRIYFVDYINREFISRALLVLKSKRVTYAMLIRIEDSIMRHLNWVYTIKKACQERFRI